MTLVAYYPYATPDDLDNAYETPDDRARFDLGAVTKLTKPQIEQYGIQVAGFTRGATWAIDTNTVAVLMKITDCADQDAVVARAGTLGGSAKTLQGSLAEARKRKSLVCAPTTTPGTTGTGMSTTTKLLLGGGLAAVVGIGAVVLLRRR
jgi:hypothetical protein